jgi:hypothetical protein
MTYDKLALLFTFLLFVPMLSVSVKAVCNDYLYACDYPNQPDCSLSYFVCSQCGLNRYIFGHVFSNPAEANERYSWTGANNFYGWFHGQCVNATNTPYPQTNEIVTVNNGTTTTSTSTGSVYASDHPIIPSGQPVCLVAIGNETAGFERLNDTFYSGDYTTYGNEATITVKSDDTGRNKVVYVMVNPNDYIPQGSTILNATLFYRQYAGSPLQNDEIDLHNVTLFPSGWIEYQAGDGHGGLTYSGVVPCGRTDMYTGVQLNASCTDTISKDNASYFSDSENEWDVTSILSSIVNAPDRTFMVALTKNYTISGSDFGFHSKDYSYTVNLSYPKEPVVVVYFSSPSANCPQPITPHANNVTQLLNQNDYNVTGTTTTTTTSTPIISAGGVCRPCDYSTFIRPNALDTYVLRGECLFSNLFVCNPFLFEIGLVFFLFVGILLVVLSKSGKLKELLGD